MTGNELKLYRRLKAPVFATESEQQTVKLFTEFIATLKTESLFQDAIYSICP
jgi:hypothetical protein